MYVDGPKVEVWRWPTSRKLLGAGFELLYEDDGSISLLAPGSSLEVAKCLLGMALSDFMRVTGTPP